MPTRQRILDAALEAFSHYGWQRVEMTDVAARVGLSRQGLYRHFGSKEELFRAVVEHVHALTLDTAVAAADRQTEPVAMLVALIRERSLWFLEKIYGTQHGAELLGESNRQCSDLNEAASRRFLGLVTARIKRAGLKLPPGMSAGSLAALLVQASNGLKTSQLTPAAYSRGVEQLVSLMCKSLVVPPKKQKKEQRHG